MKRSSLAVLGALVLMFGSIMMAGPVLADWNEGDPAKWVQLPDLTPNGVDVAAFGYGYYIVADDFQCKETGLITGIHIWGSYLEDHVQPLDLQLAIWSDVPKSQSNPYSHPGELLWDMDIHKNEYKTRLYQQLTNPEYFMEPSIPAYLEPGDKQVWQFNFSIPPEKAFKQEEGNIYWLSVHVYEPIVFGWKSARLDQRWNDDAVWASHTTTTWFPLKYLGDHPYAGKSMDLAFVITPIPGSLLLLGTGLLGLAGLGWRFRK